MDAAIGVFWSRYADPAVTVPCSGGAAKHVIPEECQHANAIRIARVSAETAHSILLANSAMMAIPVAATDAAISVI